MRVIHLLSHCRRGFGNVNVAVDLACTQAKMGYAVTVASHGGDFENLLLRHGVEHAMIGHSKKDPVSALTALWHIVALIRQFKPDVLHAHMMPGALLGFLASKITGVPLINTVHNSFDPQSIVMRLGQRVVAVCEAERALLLQRGYNPDQLSVVLNGPNQSPRDDFFPGREEPEFRRPCVVTACGLHRRKGLDDLIRAFAEAAPAGPWQLYIAGHGPDRDSLIELARSLGVGDRVHLTGFVERPKRMLEQCDIFVLASLSEPCSLSLAEARDAGCAVIATSVGGNLELLEYGRAGALVPPGQPRALAHALRELLASPERLESAKRESKQNSEHLRVDRVVRDYERVYQDVLASIASLRVGRFQMLASGVGRLASVARIAGR